MKMMQQYIESGNKRDRRTKHDDDDDDDGATQVFDHDLVFN